MAAPTSTQVIQALMHSSEQDLAGHIMLFRGAVYRADTLGCERERRMAHEALENLLAGIGALWREQMGIGEAARSSDDGDNNGTPIQ